MNKVLLIPDSFKGTLSSAEICGLMREAILANYPECQVVCIPVADGGEGSVDAFLAAMGGEKISIIVKDPFMQDMESFYGMLPDGTAVIEMAACAGLPLAEGRKNPCTTTTFGVGQMMKDALRRGCLKIIVGLGGSCTNDLGAGAAAAMGVRFINREGREFVPTGGNLGDICSIDMSGLPSELKDVSITTMCDIDNPLYGLNGAAHIFAPQKGADEAMVLLLDEQLRLGADIIAKELGKDIGCIPGAGAAGGMGGGMVAFFGSQLQMGIQTVLDVVGFNELLPGTDAVFTGEGKIDSQTLSGKVVVGVAQRAKLQNVPVFAIVGDIGDDIDAVYEQGVSGIFSINRVAVDFKEARLRSKSDLLLTMHNLMHSFKALRF